MKNHHATTESMGEGWINPTEAANRWNEFITPILEAEIKWDQPEGDDPLISMGNGRAAYAHDWAWDKFCELGAGDSNEVCKKLAAELEIRIKL